MSRWLDLARDEGETLYSPPDQAELKSKALPANRHEPAERGRNQLKREFLPVSAGLPVKELEEPEPRNDHNMAHRSDADSPYGNSPGGRPLTHTGRVVSLDAWRRLTKWEKHGPNGRHWNGVTQRWEASE